jgi:hypothetical protein
MTASRKTDRGASPRLRHDPPDMPGYRISERPAIPVVRLARLALPLMIPFGLIFYVAGHLLAPGGTSIRFSIPAIIAIPIIALVIVPLVHEAMHGAAAWLLGAKPFFGIGPGYAFTSFREPVPPRTYLLIGAAPFVLLSVVCLVLFSIVPAWFLFILVFASVNAASSIGDFWVINQIRRLPSNALIFDLADGYAAFVPDDRS